MMAVLIYFQKMQTSKEVSSILALTAVSYVGCISSIILLSATVFIHLNYRFVIVFCLVTPLWFQKFFSKL